MKRRFHAGALLPMMLATTVLVALADHSLAGPLGGFAFALPVAATFLSALAFHRAIGWHPLAMAMLCSVLASAVLAENLSPLSFAMALSLASLAIIALSGFKPSGAMSLLGRFILTSLLAPLTLAFDLLRLNRARRHMGKPVLRRMQLGVWLMPVSAALVFLLLFISANPVLDHWIAAFDIAWLLEWIDIGRLVLWAVLAGMIWPVLRARLPLRLRISGTVAAKRAGTTSVAAGNGVLETFFGEAAILRALVLFNLLFALQTSMDIAYLWGGVALPDGMSYAGYAHRGAYPLIVTALLAAGFVLAATRPGTAPATNPAILLLVGVWVMQNIGLVLSSILRLDLYVSVYALTYWRVAAFIWMGLVAAGLALILIRIATRRSIDWLVGANLAILACVLMASCFVNFASLIATHNANQMLSGKARPVMLDAAYMGSLGPQALPAITRLLEECRREDGSRLNARQCGTLERYRAALTRQHEEAMGGDWRGKGLRSLRLAARIADNPQLTQTMPQYFDGQTSGDREP
ncbi:MAG: DUF4173 domain-containing protein [Notoacmeibacter sp.]|nr:DUF4173 domain-containing protein [Notoacmeibacter sp.]MCC0033321.1 DUF4173 domain-containing protein [Brucellaceae bacterium]